MVIVFFDKFGFVLIGKGLIGVEVFCKRYYLCLIVVWVYVDIEFCFCCWINFCVLCCIIDELVFVG